MAYPILPDPALAAEFKKTPLGHHSPALQRLLRIFRTLPVAGKHALLRVDHRRSWVLVQFNGRKGEPLTIHRDHVFTDWTGGRMGGLQAALAGIFRHAGAGGARVTRTLAGYTDRISACPGDTMAFKVSAEDGSQSYRASLVRLHCVDSHRDGPGLQEEAIASDLDGIYAARHQPIPSVRAV